LQNGHSFSIQLFDNKRFIEIFDSTLIGNLEVFIPRGFLSEKRSKYCQNPVIIGVVENYFSSKVWKIEKLPHKFAQIFYHT